MSDTLSFMARDVVVQSTLVFLVALAIARFAVRRPARVHTVLTLAFVAAMIAPVASEGVRRAGWGLLPPEAPNPPANAVAAIDFASTMPQESRASVERQVPIEAAPQMADVVLPEHHTDRVAEPAASAAVVTTTQDHVERPGVSVVSGRALWIMTFGFWLVASVFLVRRLLGGVVSARHVLRSATPCREPAVAAALIAARDRLHMNQVNVEAFESSLVRCPMIWCWGRRPKLLLPVDAARTWSAATWTPVLCHELAHWKRRDHWAALVAEVVCCLMPWQVLAWWAKRRLEHASEQACDDWTVAVGHSAVDYAETLLGLVAQADPPLALAALRRRSGLAGRVQHILSQTVPHPRLGRAWAFVALTFVIFAISVAAVCQRGTVMAGSPTAAAKNSKDNPKQSDVNGSDDASKPAPIAVGKPKETMPGKDAPTDGAPPTPGVAVDVKSDNSRPKHWKAHGRVATTGGEPIANADVYWDVSERPQFDGGEWPSHTTRAHAKTDSQGGFVLEADFSQESLAYQYIVVRAAGYGVRARTSIDPAKLHEPLEIQMEQSYPIEGTVFSPNGAPVAGARVRVSSLQRRHDPDAKRDSQQGWYLSLGRNETRLDHPRDYWPAPAVTGADGKFVVDDAMPHTATAELIIDADEFALTPVVVAGPDATKDPQTEYREPGFTLVLENPYVAHGRFVDEKTGEPIPNVRLEVEPGAYGRARFTRQVITAASDEDGRYTLRFGSADYYSTQVFPPAGYPGVRTSFNSRTIAQLAGSDRAFDQEVKLRRGLMLKGRVVDGETGEGVPSAQVHYKLLKGRKIGVNNRFEPVTTDHDGAFSITGVDGKGFLLVDAPRKPFYRLAITDPRVDQYREGIYPHGMLEVDVPKEGQADPLVISLKRGPELAIRALSPEGEPVKQLRAACEESTYDGFFSGQQIADGVFRLNAAEPGRKYRVFLFSEDAMAGGVAEVEAPSDGQPIDITLQPCATIRGRYVYDGGAPAPEVSNFTRFRMYPDQKPEGNAAFNLPFYDNFSGHQHKKRATDNDGYFELDGIIPGAYMYLDVNFNFANGTRSHDIGILKPGEIKDVGELVIHAR